MHLRYISSAHSDEGSIPCSAIYLQYSGCCIRHSRHRIKATVCSACSLCLGIRPDDNFLSHFHVPEVCSSCRTAQQLSCSSLPFTSSEPQSSGLDCVLGCRSLAGQNQNSVARVCIEWPLFGSSTLESNEQYVAVSRSMPCPRKEMYNSRQPPPPLVDIDTLIEVAAEI